MRLDWLKFGMLSLILNIMMVLFVSCQSERTPSVTASNSIESSKIKLNDSSKDLSNELGEVRQRYHLKFLSPYTQYPVRLKDHYGKKGNTRWYKHGSKAYIDIIALSSKFYSTEDDYMGNARSTHLLLTNYDTKSNFVLDHYEPKHQDAIPRNSNHVYDYDYTFENNIGIIRSSFELNRYRSLSSSLGC